jgi:hypothetical protein
MTFLSDDTEASDERNEECAPGGNPSPPTLSCSAQSELSIWMVEIENSAWVRKCATGHRCHLGPEEGKSDTIMESHPSVIPPE